jgi:hypothetical protein
MDSNTINRIVGLQELINITAGSGLSCEEMLIKSCEDEIKGILDNVLTNESHE